MTSRDRVLRTLERREPDRVPYNLRPSPEAVARLRAEAGEVDFADYFRHDVRYAAIALPQCLEGTPVQEWTPDPPPEAVAAAAEQTAALQARGLAVCGAYGVGLFEQAKHWLGDAETLLAPYDDPRGFAHTLDRITAWKCALYGAYVTAGVDIVWIGDDLGTQRSLVMSPAQYRQWYRPRHQQLVDYLRRLRPVKIAFHCCGHVTPLIPDLIEVGIDVLEAVQAEAMDLEFLKREFGRDLAFWGGVGAQSVLARTTPEQVKAGVRQTLDLMAPGGGYIAAPCHTLTDEVSWEAVVAFHEALGEYPGYGERQAGR